MLSSILIASAKAVPVARLRTGALSQRPALHRLGEGSEACIRNLVITEPKCLHGTSNKCSESAHAHANKGMGRRHIRAHLQLVQRPLPTWAWSDCLRKGRQHQPTCPAIEVKHPRAVLPLSVVLEIELTSNKTWVFLREACSMLSQGMGTRHSNQFPSSSELGECTCQVSRHGDKAVGRQQTSQVVQRPAGQSREHDFAGLITHAT